MASQTGKDSSNILILGNNTVARECPRQALVPGDFARFIVLSTPLRGMELVLRPGKDRSIWVLGSGMGVDFVIADSTLLSAHLYIEFSGAEWLVTCHRDCWGFYVNGEPVETAVVEHGDRVRVGRHELVFVGSRPAELFEEEKELGKGWWRWFKRAS